MNIHLQKIVLNYIDYKLKYEEQLLRKCRDIKYKMDTWIFYNQRDKYKCISSNRKVYCYVKYTHDNNEWYIYNHY